MLLNTLTSAVPEYAQMLCIVHFDNIIVFFNPVTGEHNAQHFGRRYETEFDNTEDNSQKHSAEAHKERKSDAKKLRMKSGSSESASVRGDAASSAGGPGMCPLPKKDEEDDDDFFG